MEPEKTQDRAEWMRVDGDRRDWLVIEHADGSLEDLGYVTVKRFIPVLAQHVNPLDIDRKGAIAWRAEDGRGASVPLTSADYEGGKLREPHTVDFPDGTRQLWHRRAGVPDRQGARQDQHGPERARLDALQGRDRLTLKGLTVRRREVLRFAMAEVVDRGVFPTLRRIMAEVGINSLRGADIHLEALVRKCYLQKEGMMRKHSYRVIRDEAFQPVRLAFVPDAEPPVIAHQIVQAVSAAMPRPSKTV